MTKKPNDKQRDRKDSPGDELKAGWNCNRDSIAEGGTGKEESNTV